MLPHLRNPFPGMSRPAATPLWNEGRIPLEAANLLRSRVFAGEGVHRGEDRPVLLIPGFMAGDSTLALMTRWLRRVGYRTSRAGMRANLDCSQRSIDRIALRIDELAERYGHPVAIIGHSRGGVFARTLAVQYPELVAGIVTLGSPLTEMLRINPVVMAQVFAVATAGSVRLPGFFSHNCWEGDCCDPFREAQHAPFPEGVGYVSVYSKRDGVVDWRCCLDEAAQAFEVRSSHCGMAMDAATYRMIGTALHQFSTRAAGQPVHLPLAVAA